MRPGTLGGAKKTTRGRSGPSDATNLYFGSAWGALLALRGGELGEECAHKLGKASCSWALPSACGPLRALSFGPGLFGGQIFKTWPQMCSFTSAQLEGALTLTVKLRLATRAAKLALFRGANSLEPGGQLNKLGPDLEGLPKKAA